MVRFVTAPNCATTATFAIEESGVNPVRNILAIVDPTAQEHPAVEKAALLAQHLDARLELLICDTKAARGRASRRMRAVMRRSHSSPT